MEIQFLLDRKQKEVKENITNKDKILKGIFSENKKITAIVGLSKNSGKTTFLNWLLSKTKIVNCGIITTGRDGEDLDLVSGNKKPKVIIPNNFYYSTLSHEISHNSHLLEVIEKLPFMAVGKPLWLVKTHAEIEAEIVGPASVKSQLALANHILEKGANHIYIDGALDRKSIALSDKIDSLIIVVSPVAGNLNKIIRELKKLYLLSKIPQESSKFSQIENICLIKNKQIKELSLKYLFGNEQNLLEKVKNYSPDKIFLPGAITDKSFPKLIPILKISNLIIKHPLNLQISDIQLKKLFELTNITTLTKFHLDGIAVNSFGVNGDSFDCTEMRNSIRLAFNDIPVIDIYEWEK